MHLNLWEQCLALGKHPINISMCNSCCCYCCCCYYKIAILYLLFQEWPYRKCHSILTQFALSLILAKRVSFAFLLKYCPTPFLIPEKCDFGFPTLSTKSLRGGEDSVRECILFPCLNGKTAFASAKTKIYLNG